MWAIIERWLVNVHPAYRIGFGRVSCARCIFGSPNQWASARVVDPVAFETVAAYERRFGVVHVDYATQVRTLKDSGRHLQAFLRARRNR